MVRATKKQAGQPEELSLTYDERLNLVYDGLMSFAEFMRWIVEVPYGFYNVLSDWVDPENWRFIELEIRDVDESWRCTIGLKPVQAHRFPPDLDIPF